MHVLTPPNESINPIAVGDQPGIQVEMWRDVSAKAFV